MFFVFFRPSAGNGLWLAYLLPLTYMINTAKLNKQVDFDFKITTIISFGLMLQSTEIYCKLACERNSKILNALTKLLPGAFTSFLVWICLLQEVPFSMICGFGSCLLYDLLYVYLMKALPRSFTLGEAAVVTQGIVIFLFNAFLQLPSYWIGEEILEKEMDKMKPVLQIWLIGLMSLITLIHFIPLLRRPFLIYPLLILFAVIMIALPTPDRMPQIYCLINIIVRDNERVRSYLFIAKNFSQKSSFTIFSCSSLQSTVFCC